eukprot:gene17400-23702_t
MVPLDVYILADASNQPMSQHLEDFLHSSEHLISSLSMAFSNATIGLGFYTGDEDHNLKFHNLVPVSPLNVPTFVSAAQHLAHSIPTDAPGVPAAANAFDQILKFEAEIGWRQDAARLILWLGSSSIKYKLVNVLDVAGADDTGAASRLATVSGGRFVSADKLSHEFVADHIVEIVLKDLAGFSVMVEPVVRCPEASNLKLSVAPSRLALTGAHPANFDISITFYDTGSRPEPAIFCPNRSFHRSDALHEKPHASDVCLSSTPDRFEVSITSNGAVNDDSLDFDASCTVHFVDGYTNIPIGPSYNIPLRAEPLIEADGCNDSSGTYLDGASCPDLSYYPHGQSHRI